MGKIDLFFKDFLSSTIIMQYFDRFFFSTDWNFLLKYINRAIQKISYTYVKYIRNKVIISKLFFTSMKKYGK